MINATEARKISKQSFNNNPALQEAVEKVLPLIEERINSAAHQGWMEVCITKQTIQATTGFVMWATQAELLEAIARKVETFGYKTTIPQSKTSIHIYW